MLLVMTKDAPSRGSRSDRHRVVLVEMPIRGSMPMTSTAWNWSTGCRWRWRRCWTIRKLSFCATAAAESRAVTGTRCPNSLVPPNCPEQNCLPPLPLGDWTRPVRGRQQRFPVGQVLPCSAAAPTVAESRRPSALKSRICGSSPASMTPPAMPRCRAANRAASDGATPTALADRPKIRKLSSGSMETAENRVQISAMMPEPRRWLLEGAIGQRVADSRVQPDRPAMNRPPKISRSPYSPVAPGMAEDGRSVPAIFKKRVWIVAASMTSEDDPVSPTGKVSSNTLRWARRPRPWTLPNWCPIPSGKCLKRQ